VSHQNVVCERRQPYFTTEVSEDVWQICHEGKTWQPDNFRLFRLPLYAIWMTEKEISKLPHQDIGLLPEDEADKFLEWFDNERTHQRDL
jgi:hypothetical protein